MSTPKHRRRAGSSYFVTSRCWQGRSLFQIPENAQLFLDALFEYRSRDEYLLHEFVVMPNHFHLLMTPGLKTSLERAVQLIKGGSSHRIHKLRGSAMPIWQQGFYDWTIRDAGDWEAKVRYIHENPVRAKLLVDGQVWPYSSANGRFVMDPRPQRYSLNASGASSPSETAGLKSRPPENIPIGRDSNKRVREGDVGAKACLRRQAPTP
jgi:putative transposase